MSQSHFQKFVPKKKNSAIKEAIRQNKKKAKKERAAAIDRHFEGKRKLREAAREAALNAPVSVSIAPVKKDKVKTIEANFKQAEKIKSISREFAPAPVTKPGKPAPASDVQMPLNK